MLTLNEEGHSCGIILVPKMLGLMKELSEDVDVKESLAAVIVKCAN